MTTTTTIALLLCAPIALALGASAARAGGPADDAPGASPRPIEAPAGSWTHLGRTPWRTPWAQSPDVGPASLGSIAWTASKDDLGREVYIQGGVGVVVGAGLVLSTGFAEGEPVALAFDTGTGVCAWSSPIPAPAFSSWSTPAIDTRNGTLLVASGAELRAIGLADGAPAWSAALERPVVNASPLVTSDRGPRDRAFVTDYALADLGAAGRLYCVNVDAYDALENPHEPGEVVWSVPLGAGEIGGTPAYLGDRVYAATSEGRVLALPAGAEAAPAPLWVYENASGDGFYGGVSVFGGAVYAATYDFGVGQLAGEMVKLDAATGAEVWSVACNRTDSVPVPMGGGLIALSGGVPPDPFLFDHESAPSLALFQDLGPACVMLWDTALETWDDDGDGVIENGEFLSVGGWTHTPALVRRGGKTLLFVGSMDEGDLGGALFLPGVQMRLLDPMRLPTDPMFVLDEDDRFGASPAVSGETLYSIGPGGVVAVRAPGGIGAETRGTRP